MIRYETKRRIETQVEDLVDHFPYYLAVFRGRNPFTGYQINLHRSLLDARSRYLSVAEAIRDQKFVARLHELLAAWGMQSRKAVLVSESEMAASLNDQAQNIVSLEGFRICELKAEESVNVTERIWQVISGLRLGKQATKIVVNSKALHHLLPMLIPPIDREYTVRFFFRNPSAWRIDREAEQFREMYSWMHQIALRAKVAILDALAVGEGMDTSETKVIDNAIVGYCKVHSP